MKKRKLISTIVILLGIALLLCAGGLFLYNMNESNTQAREAGDIVTRVKEQVANNIEEADPSSQAPAPLEERELVPVLVEGSEYDGYLTIPSIDLEMAVYDTWNDEYLHKSLCRYHGSPYTDDLIIAGHNYRSSFGKLKKMAVGDEVYFTDMQGVVIRYKVTQIEVIGGTDIARMLDGDWDLSLYTCTYGGSDRLTVRCERS